MGKHLPIALRYRGGKSKIAEWVISYFPAHKIYIEPFGGGYDSILYDTLYPTFRKVSKTSMAASFKGGVSTVEVLWISPNIKNNTLF